MNKLRKFFLWFAVAWMSVPKLCKYTDIVDGHDYQRNKGGDGTPTHFYEYTCWNCGHKYYI